ncbi:uncharacterized protein Coop [Drosophila tropicalis]|uniref:uncharacterized protein Coop n=1 Tax=Drosophila tropicalis TaxID=46794 RepID=UPI0035ABB83D
MMAYNHASSSSASPSPLSSSLSPAAVVPSMAYTNTAKLPIETVKRLIASVSRRPILWLRNNGSGQKRSDITPIWFEVGQDVNLPADICRIKWGHLRDNFRKVYIRNNLSNETPSSWRFYNDMRFMEHAVHENIMRQTRSSSKKYPPNNWSENNNITRGAKYDAMLATEPICELSDSYDSEMHQPSFSDISCFFENRENENQYQPEDQENNSKRIKLEEEEEQDDDDDFDEDAASENTTPDAGVFTIEVLDDDEEMAMPLSKIKSNNSGSSSDTETKPATIASRPPSTSVVTSDLPFKYISMDAATNTEPQEDNDADRMFLLSLMPFLQKLQDERRKLRVRQKLQNVLIEELEFG